MESDTCPLFPNEVSSLRVGGPYAGINDGHVTLLVICIESWVLHEGWLMWTWSV